MNRFLRTLTLPLDVGIRANEIALALSRYGVAEMLGSLGLEFSRRGLGAVGARKGPQQPMDKVFGKRLARLFVKLGPTFIKLGQVLATRPDLVGDPVANELKILFDRVPALPYHKIRKILTRELGRQKLKTAFKEIDPSPLASASIGQTHRAILADGTPVVLKIQKPGVSETVRTDLVLLEALVRSIHVLYPRLQALPVFKDFRDATLREIDFRLEAQNIARFRKNYRRLFSDAEVAFPRYFPDLTTERVLALEPMHGRKVTDIKSGSTVARQVASLGLAKVLEQIFDHGFFHADPHAGNLFFLEDTGRLGFIDMGLVGQLEADDKRRFLRVLMSVLNRDREKLARSLYELGKAGRNTKYETFEGDIAQLLDDVKKTGVDKMRLDQMVTSLLRVARQNGIVIPNRYILMIRSCVVIEGVAKSLDPKISVFRIATPIIARSLMNSYNPLRYLRRLF